MIFSKRSSLQFKRILSKEAHLERCCFYSRKRRSDKPHKSFPAKLNCDNYHFMEDNLMLEDARKLLTLRSFRKLILKCFQIFLIFDFQKF